MPRASRVRLRRLTATLVAAALLAFAVPEHAQEPFDVKELAQYRLTNVVFTRFVVASRAIAGIARADPALRQAPLFTREVMLSDDARASATTLERRLRTHPGIARALDGAKLSARDYTTFVIALFAARLAHGFVESGAIRRIPEGPAASNVAFVEAHEAEVVSLLAELGIDTRF